MKNKIFIDFDNVIVNSTKIGVEILNAKFNKNVKWENVKQYNFKDQFPEATKSDIQDIFDSDDFFIKAKNNIFPDCKEIIQRLIKDYDVYILSIGTSENIHRKVKFIQEELPFVTKNIMIVKQNVIMDKSIIRMGKGDWIIDDCYSNLETSSAGNRILFSYAYLFNEWNEYGNKMEITQSWKAIERRIYGNNNDV